MGKRGIWEVSISAFWFYFQPKTTIKINLKKRSVINKLREERKWNHIKCSINLRKKKNGKTGKKKKTHKQVQWIGNHCQHVTILCQYPY